jgi:hypothetical protein
MATKENTSTLTTDIDIDQFNTATLKFEGAKALVLCLGIYMSGDGEDRPSGALLNSAMLGIANLIDSAMVDLLEKKGGAA